MMKGGDCYHMMFNSEECEIYVGSVGLLSLMISSIWVKPKPFSQIRRLSWWITLKASALSSLPAVTRVPTGDRRSLRGGKKKYCNTQSQQLLKRLNVADTELDLCDVL